MKFLEDAREALDRVWERKWLRWLTGEGSWPLRLSLGAPSQREALSDWPRFIAWRDGWTGSGAPLLSLSRVWPSLGGEQVLPAHVAFDCPEALADFLGPHRVAAWKRGQERLLAWQEQWHPGLPSGRGLRWLTEAADDDVARMQALLDWMRANPGVDIFVRQLPVPGIDTKWAQQHGATALDLMQSAMHADAPGTRAFKQDRSRVRMRLLDPFLRAKVGGLDDVSAPIASISALLLPLRCAVVVENLQTFLAFDDIPGVALFFGAGFGARGLRQVAWLRDLPILYWGDLDTAGFEILSAVRSALPQVVSFGMDEATLETHRALCVPDHKQRRAELQGLTSAEAATYHRLLTDEVFAGMRLEQERLGWAKQWTGVLDAVAKLSANKALAQ